MRVGMNLMLWTCAPEFERHGPLLEKLSAMGYDAVELCVGGLAPGEAARFAAKAREFGLATSAVDLFQASEGNIISPDARMRELAVKRIKRSVDRACDLESGVLSGPFFQGLNDAPTSAGPTADEWRRAVDGLGECALYAAGRGVRIAAEPLNRFEMHIVNTLEAAYRMCLDIGLANMGILADTHHANIEELDVTAAFVKHADRIFNIHISENNRGIPGSGHGIPASLFPALRDAGYEGLLVIEAFNANVAEVLPLLRIWSPFAQSEDEIAQKGLEFIKSNL